MHFLRVQQQERASRYSSGRNGGDARRVRNLRKSFSPEVMAFDTSAIYTGVARFPLLEGRHREQGSA